MGWVIAIAGGIGCKTVGTLMLLAGSDLTQIFGVEGGAWYEVVGFWTLATGSLFTWMLGAGTYGEVGFWMFATGSVFTWMLGAGTYGDVGFWMLAAGSLLMESDWKASEISSTPECSGITLAGA